jgi:hypothetical protein
MTVAPHGLNVWSFPPVTKVEKGKRGIEIREGMRRHDRTGSGRPGDTSVEETKKMWLVREIAELFKMDWPKDCMSA